MRPFYMLFIRPLSGASDAAACRFGLPKRVCTQGFCLCLHPPNTRPFRPACSHIQSAAPTQQAAPICLFNVIEILGEPAGARTRDLLIKSQLLYQLSYRLSSRVRVDIEARTAGQGSQVRDARASGRLFAMALP